MDYNYSIFVSLPIRLIDENTGRIYVFHGGYGDETVKPTQPGCALIAQYLDSQGLRDTPHNLTTILFQAKEWRDTKRD